MLSLFLIFLSLGAARSQYGDELAVEEVNEVFQGFNSVCQIDISTQTGSPQPLLIRPGTDQFFHPSDRRGILEFGAAQQIELFCANFTAPIAAEGSIFVQCVGGTVFSYNGDTFNFNEFRCHRFWPVSTAVRRSDRCFNNSILVDVGFQVQTRFLKVFTSCHDPVLETNHYIEYQLTPISDANQRGVIRPNWRQLDFFPGKNVNNLHNRTTQRQTIATILNSQSAADNFIEEPNSEIYLARGHLAAMTDFISANEQRATCLFINTAPQWQTFNARNWYAVELSTRRLAAIRGITLDVYTGSYGVTHLWNESGDRRQIFLGWPASQISVPMLYYKIIIDRSASSGAVFLGVNNVHLSLSDILRDYVICKDVSSRIEYVNWIRTDIVRGYSYACEVNDFLRRVPHLQGIHVNNLLV